MNIAIIYGGKSGEHEVSVISASSIVRTIDSNHKLYLIGITKNGAWYLQDSSERERLLKDDKAVLKIKKNEKNRVFVLPGGGTKRALKTEDSFLAVDAVFPVLHGSFGEDGTIQGLFEMADLPYVGGGVTASALAMDKEKAKIIWQQAGIPVVPYISVTYDAWNTPDTQAQIILKAEKDFGYPLFVKPCRAGSSIGAGKACTKEELLKQASKAFLIDTKILIETCLPVREIECSVTGNNSITAYTPGEIIPSHDFYDYNAKYTDPNGAQLKIPADLDEEQRKTIRKFAINAYKALELTGLSRADFFLDTKTKKIYINEINTIPGFTSISMFPKMCAASGLPYKDLIMHLLDLAIERFKKERETSVSAQCGGN